MPTFYATIRDAEIDLEIDEIVSECDTVDLLNEIDSCDPDTLCLWFKENYPIPAPTPMSMALHAVDNDETCALLAAIQHVDSATMKAWIDSQRPALTEDQVTAINRAAFILETFAHLSRLETEVLPTAENLRAITNKENV